MFPDNSSFVNEKGTGHLEWIANRSPESEATAEGCFKSTLPDRQVEDLAKTCPSQSEFAVESGLWVAESSYLTISPALKEWRSLALLTHVNERNLRSRRFDRLPTCFHLGERLATECSAIVAQKDDQDRLAVGHLPQCLSILIANSLHALHLHQPPGLMREVLSGYRLQLLTVVGRKS